MTSIENAKQQAKRLRAALGEKGTTISHAEALELLARMEGLKDWNTLSARLNRPPAPWTPGYGLRLAGEIHQRPFSNARVVSVSERARKGLHKVTLQFDQPVDTGVFDRLPIRRHRLTVTLDGQGRSVDAIGRPDGVMQVKTG